ncbi:MAG: hypothetical protein KBF88_08815 [Polyangiaceae bacterium]|nr:hypothetical protein [Polyangiaceae bacterium]
MAAFLELVAPRTVSMDLVALTVAHSAFLHSQLELDENMAELRVEIERAFSSGTKLEFLDHDGSPLRTIDTVQAEEHKEAMRVARQEVEGNPLVQEIVRLFGAEIKNIRVPGEDA